LGAASSPHGQHLFADIYPRRLCRRRPQNLIAPAHNDELQKYLTGIVSGQKQKLIAVNNMPDHVHILIGLRPEMALADLVGDIKTGSSAFIKRQGWVKGRFGWQEGYGAFSYSRSQLDAVIRYIQNFSKQRVIVDTALLFARVRCCFWSFHPRNLITDIEQLWLRTLNRRNTFILLEIKKLTATAA
jgi:REP element-mobilizing transposase RayT